MRRITAILLIFVIALGFTACKDNSGTTQTSGIKELEFSDFDTTLKENDGYVVVAENEKLKLSVNGKNAWFCVTDKQSGAAWYSNPPEAENDSKAQGDGKTRLLSQLMITYIDSEDKTLYFNSYDDSVLQDQFAFYEIENGIRIIYNIGQIQKEYIVPNVISKERFESCIKNKLSDEDFFEIEPFYILQSKSDFSEKLYEEIKQKYPSIENGDIYTLSEDLPDYILEDLEKIILSTGYSKEDKQKDDLENMYKSEDSGVYFQIPVEYVIEDGDFVARVINDEIVYSDNIMFNELTFLPSFGAVGEQDSGYMLVPDGSGAIINCNNGKSSYSQYKQPVYGNDVANLDEDEAPENKTQITMPIFGIKNNENAFLAVIEKGSAAANICAQVSGSSNSYNMCCSSFSIRPENTINLTFNEDKGIYVYPSEDLSENIQIRFSFLNGEDADYNGMAAVYREYLEKENLLLKGNLDSKQNFGLELVCSVRYDTLFLGVSVESDKILTDYSQANKILEKLKSGGVQDIEMSYVYSANGGQFASAPNGIKLISDAGSKKEFQSLMSEVPNFFLQLDMQRVYKDSAFDSFNKTGDSAKSFSTEIGLFYEYDPASLAYSRAANLISPRLFDKYAKKIASDAKDIKINGLDLKDFGKILYSDNGKECLDRTESVKKTVQALESLSENASLRFNFPNAYAWKYVSGAADVPCGSDEYYLFDYSVPFYQMVTHGYFNCFTQPINLADDYEDAILNAASGGMCLNYRWIYEPNYELKDTKAVFHSLNYEAWIDRAISDYLNYNEKLGGLQDKKILEINRIDSKLTETVYENGAKVYVNFDDVKKQIGEITVEPRSYICVKEEQQ